MKLLTTLFICILLSTSSYSQSIKVSLKKETAMGIGAGYSSINSKNGWNIFGNFMGSNASYQLIGFGTIDYQFHKYSTPPDPKYRLETFSNGQKRCRDTSNGQFTKTENCNDSETVDNIFASEIDANIYTQQGKAIPFIGIGFRFIDSNIFYLSMGLIFPEVASTYFVKAHFGKEYAFGGVGIQF